MSWDKPALSSTVEYILGLYPPTKGKPLDLRHLLIFVQTAQTGRRIREALTIQASQLGGTGLFPPRIRTPYSLVQPRRAGNAHHVATELQSLAVWCKVLEGQDFHRFPALFPKAQSFSGSIPRMSLARSLEKLRGTLVEACMDCRGVLESGHCHEGERSRWENLALLEEKYLQAIDRMGWSDSRVLQREASRNPVVAEGVKQVLVIGVTDLVPLTQAALSNLSPSLEVNILCFGPSDGKGNPFDEWGRPTVEFWKDHQLELDEENIHVCLDETSQVERVVDFIANQDQTRRHKVLALGVADATLASRLHRGLDARGVNAYDPGGDSAGTHGLFAFLKGISSLLRDPSFQGAVNLLRMPPVQKSVGCVSASGLLSGLDLLQKKAIPASIHDALAVVPEKLIPDTGRYKEWDDRQRLLIREALKALHGLNSLLKKFQDTTLDEALHKLLAELDLAGFGDDVMLVEILDCLQAAGSDFSALGEKGGGLDIRQELEMTLELISRLQVFGGLPENAVKLQGWLELCWETAPHLIVTGFQDHSVPQSIIGDLFIPETLRTALGLPGNETRLARDAWQTALLLESRRPKGCVEFLLSRTSDDGDPLLPSRLLLACGQEQLIERVETLFCELSPDKSPPPFSIPWKLEPVTKQGRESLSVTSFSAYLSCPFMFFMSRKLGMDEIDARKVDLDAGEFGTLLHSVLEELARDSGKKGCGNAEVLQEFFFDQLKELMDSRYGHMRSAPLWAQVDAARERLMLAAKHQAGLIRDGWEIHKVEHRIKLPIGGINVTGIIDRVDHHPGTGAWRVIDYKTGNKGANPESVHHGETSRSAGLRQLPDYAKFELNGKERAWKDLQLPLYMLAWQHLHPNSAVEAAYFNLPDSAKDSGLIRLPMSHDLLHSALLCAEGVIGDAVTQHLFWPMRRNLRHYEKSFDRLLFHDAGNTVLEPRVVVEDAE